MTEETDTYGASSNGYKPLTKLSALDTVFAATGTAMVKVTRQGKETEIVLPIQSVDIEEVNAIVGTPPRMPRKALGGGKFVNDEQDPDYLQAVARHNRKFLYTLACMGLALDIEDETHSITWSADNQVRDLEKTRIVLRKMGLVDNQLLAITRAITQLTEVVEEEVSSD